MLFHKLNRVAKKLMRIPDLGRLPDHDALLILEDSAADEVYAGDAESDLFVFVLPRVPRGSGGLADVLHLGQALQREAGVRVWYWVTGGQSLEEAVANITWTHRDVGANQVHVVLDSVPEYLCATAWPTAYKVRSTPSRRKFYFVQDYEPMFYRASIEQYYAAKTYELGFEMITLGPWLADHIMSMHEGSTAKAVPFPVVCPLVHATSPSERCYITFYVQPNKPQRGSELLLQTARRISNEIREKKWPYEIMIFGSSDNEHIEIDFPAHILGVIAETEIQKILSNTKVGVCASFTNVSILTFRFLASGCSVVDLDLPNVRENIPDDAAGFVALSEPSVDDLAANIIKHISSSADGQRRDDMMAYIEREHAWSVAAGVLYEMMRGKDPR